jgi:hypothetical protein
VPPFELELTPRNGETADRTCPSDALCREVIAAGTRFRMNDAQILTDATDGRSVRSKPKQLRVVPVSLRLTLEHRLREKRFPPERH